MNGGTTRPSGLSPQRGGPQDSTVSAKPKLRSFRDRLRQIALFEVGGLLLITPPFAWLSGVPVTESIGLLALLALIAAIWNGCYNTSFDWVEGRLTGRTADRRPFRLRCAHAVGFETGLLMLTLPVIMWWTGMGWLEALIADIVLAITYTVYALLFNLGYDRAFPIQPTTAPRAGAEDMGTAVAAER
ncbi:MAG TPA: hypothetical protein DCY18_16345 [Thauera sp.]|nr:transmembrane pair domain-containing protein [Thauera sp. 27]HAY11473.1 hypothetical protein [Thauera sp.]